MLWFVICLQKKFLCWMNQLEEEQRIWSMMQNSCSDARVIVIQWMHHWHNELHLFSDSRKIFFINSIVIYLWTSEPGIQILLRISLIWATIPYFEFFQVPYQNWTIVSTRYNKSFFSIPVDNVDIACVSIRTCQHACFAWFNAIIPNLYTEIERWLYCQ